MKRHLDKLGAIGAVLGALAAAPACCLPLLAAAGASVGLGALAPYQGTLAYVFEAFVALAVVGAFIGFRAHRKWGPLVLAAASAVGIFYGFNVSLSQVLVFCSLGGLVLAAVWNTIEGRRCSTCVPQSSAENQSTITCPSCGHQRTETMPTDSCLVFYECTACKAMLRPKPGDCCVFCTYGTVKCPPKQAEACAC
ncbi:MAG: MerC domain-containing protein [Deltaproteobacteria bacterium]|nr:MerC domain-containing protein [Deltaproteobacteria bacterium]